MVSYLWWTKGNYLPAITPRLDHEENCSWAKIFHFETFKDLPGITINHTVFGKVSQSVVNG